MEPTTRDKVLQVALKIIAINGIIWFGHGFFRKERNREERIRAMGIATFTLMLYNLPNYDWQDIILTW